MILSDLKEQLKRRKEVNLRKRAAQGATFKGSKALRKQRKKSYQQRTQKIVHARTAPLREFKEEHGGLDHEEWLRAVDKGLTLEEVKQAPNKRILSGPTKESYPQGVFKRLHREARRDGLADKNPTTVNNQPITYQNPRGGGALATNHPDKEHTKEVFDLADRMQGIDLSTIPGLYDQKYGPGIKLHAVITWLLTGNLSQTERVLNLSKGVVSGWKRKADWWPMLVKAVQNERGEELDQELTNMIQKTYKTIQDRLEQGDYKYNSKLDKLVRVPVQAREAATIMDKAISNRNLLRGDPTSRTETVSVQENLAHLRAEFSKFNKAITVEGESEAIKDND